MRANIFSYLLCARHSARCPTDGIQSSVTGGQAALSQPVSEEATAQVCRTAAAPAEGDPQVPSCADSWCGAAPQGGVVSAPTGLPGAPCLHRANAPQVLIQ